MRSALVLSSVTLGLIAAACIGDDPQSSGPSADAGTVTTADGSVTTEGGSDPGPGDGGGALDGDAGEASACPPSVDLQNDDKNCGTCGHDCLGGQCSAGACQPRFIEDTTPTFTAVEPGTTGYVYWSDYLAGANGKVRRMPKDFTALPATLATADRPAGITLTTNLLYWTEYAGGTGTALHFANKDGTGASSTTTTFKGPWWVTADATDVYFVNRDDTIEIVSAPIGSTTTSNVFLSGGQAMGAVYIEVDATHLYVGTVANGLFRFDKSGLNKLTLAPTVTAFTVDGSQIYLTHGVGLFRIGTDGTCPTPANDCQLATGADATGSVAVDANNVYWLTTDATNGTTLHRADKSGQNAVTLYARTSDKAPGNLALDGNAIYWAVQDAGNGKGRVYRLAK